MFCSGRTKNLITQTAKTFRQHIENNFKKISKNPTEISERQAPTQSADRAKNLKIPALGAARRGPWRSSAGAQIPALATL